MRGVNAERKYQQDVGHVCLGLGEGITLSPKSNEVMQTRGYRFKDETTHFREEIDPNGKHSVL